MSACALRAASWYLPARSVAVGELPELAALTPAQRRTCLALGIDRVPADDGLDAVELAVRAARQALAEAGLSPDELDALIVVDSRAPEAFAVSEATRTQALLGAGRALAFSVGGLGCTSVVPGLLAARGLLAADPDVRHVLVTHGSKPAAPHRYRHPVTVYGDSGQALVVARDGPVRILDILAETSGAYWDLFRVDFRDRPYERWREECTDIPRYSFELAMESRNRIRGLYRRILDRNGRLPSDIRYHITQNMSAGSFRFHAEVLGVAVDEACPDNLRRYGHLGPNDVLFNLYSALARDGTDGAAEAVLLNASPSASWSAMLVESGARPGSRSHFL
ncbi:3-oxoacyl-ACP synthase [Streptomyces beigongshangae]|uniref:3-oxoacyl-ACP synthase n=1 Tax=Streptomyces beigongshangae TaxID=2841597 RepID=UPI0021A4EB2A|nr:3-oxoacyl-ACP synthase [Streptomyces sp. REN17]